jgi:hypothetical protein
MQRPLPPRKGPSRNVTDAKLFAKGMFGLAAFIYLYSQLVLFISDSNNYQSNKERMTGAPRILRWNRAADE